MKLISKCLGCCKQNGPGRSARITWKDRCTGKTEHIVVLKSATFPCTLSICTTCNCKMHITKLASMTFIKDDDNLLMIDRMIFVLFDEGGKLLNGCNDDLWFTVRQLFCKNSSRSVAVGSTFFKSVIFFHCLIVQIFSIYNKQYFINKWKLWSKPCCFKGCQCFTWTCCMPDITTGSYCSILLIVMRYFNTIQYSFSCGNLIWTHYHQNVFWCKDTVSC